MPNRRKALGSRLENTLANMLWSMGFAVVRGPSSGAGARRRFQPDIVAVREGVVLVIEVKRGREGERLYVPSRQVEGLREFARRSGGLALVIVHVPRRGWRVFELEDLPRTPAGSARIDRPESGTRLEAYMERLFPRSRRIDEFL